MLPCRLKPKHLTSTLKCINPDGGLDKLNVATESMHLMQVITVSQRENDSLLGGQEETWSCVGDVCLKLCCVLAPSGQRGRG